METTFLLPLTGYSLNFQFGFPLNCGTFFWIDVQVELIMSPKKKFYRTLISVMLFGWSLIGLWAATDHPIFVAFLLVWVFLGSWIICSVKCPNCGVSLSYQGSIGFLKIYGAMARSKCQNCGHNLNEPSWEGLERLFEQFLRCCIGSAVLVIYLVFT